MNWGRQCKDHNRQAVWLAIILTESAFNKYSGHCETSRKLVDSSLSPHLLRAVQRLPQLPELREVDGHVPVRVRGLDVRDGLGLGHVAAHLGPIRDEYRVVT